MKRHRNPWLFALTAAAMIFLAACDDNNDTGLQVLPDEDIISGLSTDTLTLVGRTLRLDSVSSTRLTRNLVGEYVDPEFGRISAGTYTQLEPSGSNVVFSEIPSNLTLDSIVLSIDLTDFYGRFNEPLDLEVFEVLETLEDTIDYKTHDFVNFDSSYNYAAGKKIDFSDQAGFFDFLEIRLDDSLGRKFLFADAADLESVDAFQDFFKGLLIRSKPVALNGAREPGGVFSFDPLSSKTFLKLHYKDTTSVEEFSFVVGTGSNRYHTIKRTDFSGTLYEQMVADTVTPFPTNFAFEAGALTKFFIKAPHLDSIVGGINRAELILNVDPQYYGSDGRFSPPNEMFLFLADSAGREELEAAAFINSASFDPTNNQYVVTITNTVMNTIIDRIDNYGFILVPGSNGVTLNRAVIGGPSHPNLAPKLRVTYTTLPK